MKELLEYIAKKILSHPDDIRIDEQTDENGNVNITLITHPDDIGLAIGKGGRTAHSLRELLKIKAMQMRVRVFLTIKTPDEVASDEQSKE